MTTYVRFIQGFRVYCTKCNKTVTPVLIIMNDAVKDGEEERTHEIQFDCDRCKTVIKRVKV